MNDEFAGLRTKCPKCGAPVQAPAPTSSVPQAPAAVESAQRRRPRLEETARAQQEYWKAIQCFEKLRESRRDDVGDGRTAIRHLEQLLASDPQTEDLRERIEFPRREFGFSKGLGAAGLSTPARFAGLALLAVDQGGHGSRSSG